jgi:hypothetical protein
MIRRRAGSRIRGLADRGRENYGSAPYPARLSRSKPYLPATGLHSVTDAGRRRPGERAGMDRFCPLEALGGRKRACPEVGCPFWEPGGAVVQGRCAFERLDLAGRPEVAAELLRIREQLSSVSAEDERRCWARYHHVLNESTDE